MANHENLNQELTALLHKNGCDIVGFADLRILPEEMRQGYDCGILLALPFSKEAMVENNQGQPQRYYDEHKPMDEAFTRLRALTAQFLHSRGYQALTDTPACVIDKNTLCAMLPQKTVATLAGIGWIGKTAMLVTHKAGSAVRMTAVLTDAPFACAAPVMKSLCDPDCNACFEACPGKAPLGGLWEVGVAREEFFNAHACQAAAHARAKATLGIDKAMCGLCISSCPITKKGLGYF